MVTTKKLAPPFRDKQRKEGKTVFTTDKPCRAWWIMSAILELGDRD